MKKLLVLSALLLATCILAGDALVGSGQIIKTVAATGTPEQFTNAATYVRRVTILGKKAARTDNVGTVYIGPIAANDAQAFPVLSGGEVIIEAQPGALINMADWYIDVLNAGDGVVLIYH